MKLVSPLLVLFLAACSSPPASTTVGDASTPHVHDSAASDGSGATHRDASTPPDSAAEHDAGKSIPDAAADHAGDAAFAPAKHTPFPQIPDNGGPTLTAPQLVTIAFDGDTNGATLSSFGDWIVTSQWLTTVGHDYGIGQGTHVKHVVLPGPAPQTPSDLDVQALLEMNLENGSLPSGGFDGGTPDGAVSEYLYMIMFPSTSSVGSFLGGPSTCAFEGGDSFIGGYHWETQSGPYHVAYAVIPTCTQGSAVEGAADLEMSASHEFIEASTDPFPYTDVAYGIIDTSNPWIVTAGEVADLCEGQVTEEAGFTAQLIWSNSAAKGEGSPCVPAPAGAFFDVAPGTAQALSMQAGTIKTVTLTGFSSAPIAAWSIDTFIGDSTFTPDVALAAKTINNGMITTLKIGVPAGTPAQSYAAIYVDSYQSGSESFVFWPIEVGVP